MPLASAQARRRGQPILSDAILRDAELEDAEAIGALHARVWAETYRDLATPEALATLDATRRAAGWRAVLSNPAATSELIVAEAAGQIIGFTAIGPAGHEIFGPRGEIKQLYVDQAHQGAGLGARLMKAAAERLAMRGYKNCGLAVVVGNDRASAFYHRLGGVDAGGFTDAGPLWKSANRLIVWDDIASLADRSS